MRRLGLFYFDVPALRPGSVGAYAFAFVCAAVATAVRIAIDPYVTGILLVTFLPAVVITALISGFGAGLFCVMLSAAAADFSVLEPRWSFYIANPAEALDLLALVLVGMLIVIVIAEMRAAIERYRELRRKLEHRVEERSAEIADVRKRLQHEATFRAMFNISSVGKVEVEPETGRFLRANEAICKFVGYSEAELLARTVFDISHPNYLDRGRELLRRLLAGDSGFDVETCYIRKDGKAVWARTTMNVIRDEFGRPWRNTAVIQDISERKDREEREHLLIREINHRAKNMLSVVDAIARQTATKDPERFVECFAERIQALSANQDLLVRNQWQGVDIGDLVRAQLSHFADLIGSRIVVDGAKLRLQATGAQAIGLALHELATNAGKYGALSTDMGRVDVCWETDGDTFTMTWTERDGPPVSAPDRRGFGTIVMKAMAERSVDGTVNLHYAPSGVAWRLTCPAANALELDSFMTAENQTDRATSNQHGSNRFNIGSTEIRRTKIRPTA